VTVVIIPDMSCDALGAISFGVLFDVPSRDAAAAGEHFGSGEDESLAALGSGKQSTVG
jgi:hypothetical protein